MPTSPAPALPDWSQPWFRPWAGAGRAALAAHAPGVPAHEALNRALPDACVRFAPPHAAPPPQAYEAFIYQSGRVPTREGWHDFFNALVWHGLPRTKQRMNALQAAAIARDGVGARRGPVRDALTVLDENGALLHAPDALWHALHTRQWAALFGPLRPLWAQASLLVMGHAALEKLLTPYKSITAHVWRVAQPFDALDDASRAALDAWLAHDLHPDKLATKPFAPLPLLGVPGWWEANEQAGFYADPDVFRPRRAGHIPPP